MTLATPTIRILVIDHESDVSALTKEHLDHPGEMEVRACPSVQVARAAIVADHYDAIVSDYQMDGEEVIHFLRSLRENGDRTPFIIFTAQEREEVVIEALNNGADGYLKKGGNPRTVYAELRHRISAAVRRHRMEESLRSHNEGLHEVNEELRAAERELRVQLDEIVRGQEELGKEMAFSASLMDSLPGIFYLYEADSLRLVRWNKNHQELSGYTPEEMFGKHVLSWHRPENTDSVLAAIDSCMRSGQGSIEAPLVMKDGHQVQYLLTGKRFDTKDTSFFMGMGIDIEDRTLAERILRDSGVMHRAILENAGVGLAYWDLDGRLILMNSIAAGHLNGKLEDFTGRDIWDLFGEEAGDRYLDRIKRAVTAEKPMEYEDLVPLPGKELWFLSVFAYVSGPTPGESGVLILSHDITERKNIEMALHLANQKLNLLSSITRHDINNQLVALSGYLALMEREDVSISFEQRLIKAKTAADRIASMIHFTKEYEDIGMHAPAWQNVRALIEKSVGDVQLGQIRLQNDVPAGIEILADPLIIKVFYNLVDNAVKHGVSTTTIRFLVEEREGVRSVVCEDDGAGVSPTMRKKIFTRGTGKDHGYGLFLSHEILSITGIRISEEGGPSGNGSRFVMTAGRGGIRGQ